MGIRNIPVISLFRQKLLPPHSSFGLLSMIGGFIILNYQDFPFKKSLTADVLDFHISIFELKRHNRVEVEKQFVVLSRL
jgi:hypothetical protein